MKVSRLLAEYLQYRHWCRREPRSAAVEHRFPFKLCLSLTSYPPRFRFLSAVLTPLLSQTIRPDAVVLWVAYDDVAKLPPAVWDLQSYGLRIGKCRDLRSYKKLIPVLEEDPEWGVLTVDDDRFYPETLVQEFWEAFQSQNEVLCSRAHRIHVDTAQRPLPYSSWAKGTSELGPSRLLLPTGVGGVLYPPGVFDQRVVREEVFQALCPTADDIWFFWFASLGGAAFRRIELSRQPCRVWSSQRGTGLWRVNNRGGNDVQVAAMLDEFGVPWMQ